MAPKFGTSGLRGLVVDLTPSLVANYTRAFIAACDCGEAIFVGRDLRPSSPKIADYVIKAAIAEGLDVVDCGAVPTPALALASMQAKAGAIMVTGSHIPVDRNGLKFYVPNGEISKMDEQAIGRHLGRSAGDGQGQVTTSTNAQSDFAARYIDAFGTSALMGLRIGVYQHSSVARDIMVHVIEALGADAIPLGRSDAFIPVDTEALDPATRNMLASWCSDHNLNAIISTDGDSDRPMLSDENGMIVAGDVLGALTAQYLGAKQICTPVSSNSMIWKMADFDAIRLTRIGSPFVIAEMEDILSTDPGAAVAGYEANGGFLLGFSAHLAQGVLAPLMTRDSMLPMIAPLVAAHRNGSSLAALVVELPAVFTAANRLQGIALDVSKPFLERLIIDPTARAMFFDCAGPEVGVDVTDGLRVTFQTGDIVHLRLSGNAPEFRCYAEADSRNNANALIEFYLARLEIALCA